jgi:hypothetical protein
MCEDSDLARRLREPFPASVIKFKPQTVTKDGTRAMAVAYVDATAITDRLDDVFGIGGWQDHYEVLPDGCVICTLQVFIHDVWVQKQDVGQPSGQPDEGNKRKAAFTNALKRTAVKLGIGRYISRLPKQWVEYDAQKKQLKSTPTLPPWALPAAVKATSQSSTPDQPQRIGVNEQAELQKLMKQLPMPATVETALMKLAGHEGKSLPELPQSAYEKAVDWLNRKIAQRAAEKK